MIKVTVMAGPCGFETTIKANQEEPFKATLEIRSNCPAVQKLGQGLPSMTMQDVLPRGYGKSPVFEVAGPLLPHNSCPVPSAILKAAEVAMGLALPTPPKVEFEQE